MNSDFPSRMTSDMPVTRNQVKEERTIFEDVDSMGDEEMSPPPAPVFDSSSSESSISDLDVSEKQSSSATVKPDSKQCPSPSSVSSENVAYLLWSKSSDRHPKLYSSDGFCFCLAVNGKKDCKVWNCIRNTPSFSCPASVKQLHGSDFVNDRRQHTHPSNKRSFAKVQISKALKEKCEKNPPSKLREFVKEVVARYSPENVHDLNFLEEITRNAAKERKKSLKRKRGTLTNGTDTKKLKSMVSRKKSDKKKKKKKRGKSLVLPSSPCSTSFADSTEELVAPEVAPLDQKDFMLAYLPRKSIEEFMCKGVSKPNSTNHECSSGIVGSPLPSTSAQERQPETSKPDPEEMFFYSLASEVKELPKLVRSSLKLKILTMVDEAIKNNSG